METVTTEFRGPEPGDEYIHATFGRFKLLRRMGQNFTGGWYFWGREEEGGRERVIYATDIAESRRVSR